MSSRRPILVLKVGTSTLTRGTARISHGKLEDLARQIVALRERWQVVLVSSGAIAAARHQVELHGGHPLEVKQALAAIGQPMLMRQYHEVFQDFGLRVAQCLLTHDDFTRPASRANTINTLRTLLHNGYVPIVNENDTVATEEIHFGDNDRLAAHVAVLVGARLLVLASDIDGLYEQDPRVHAEARLIREVKHPARVWHMAGEAGTPHGSGGMRSKVQAACICKEGGVEMWIVNGTEEGFLLKALSGRMQGTRFPV